MLLSAVGRHYGALVKHTFARRVALSVVSQTRLKRAPPSQAAIPRRMCTSTAPSGQAYHIRLGLAAVCVTTRQQTSPFSAVSCQECVLRCLELSGLKTSRTLRPLSGTSLAQTAQSAKQLFQCPDSCLVLTLDSYLDR